MARTFGSLNKDRPTWFALVSPMRPACFVSQSGWDSYLDSVHAESVNDEALRGRLNRGEVPDFCCDCTARHQRRMHQAGLCVPPPGASSPLLPIELEPSDD